MARKAAPPPAPPRSRLRFALSLAAYAIILTAAGVVLVGGLYAFHRAERFLVRDSRFAFVSPDIGLQSPSLKIDGLHYASRAHVLRVFSEDFGRSIYLMPLAERRRQLMALDWVRDAAVARIWPNRIDVRVDERRPVAYVQLPVDEFARIALIDAEGIILQMPQHAAFTLPVVTGIRPAEVQPLRREKVRRFLYVMKDLGPLGEHVSEMDVSDRSNLKVTTKANHRAVVLYLGDQNFSARLQNFVTHYPDIQRRLPGATILDLRLEDRITVVDR
jgi:cell division protein FtsQ